MSCAFFKEYGTCGTTDKLENALVIATAKAERNALLIFKERLRILLAKYGVDIPNAELLNIFNEHTSDILREMQMQFAGETAILNRVADAQKNPALVGLPDAEPLDDFFHSGFIFLLFWYGVTGESGNVSIAVTLNHSHADSIDEVLANAADELAGSADYKQVTGKLQASKKQKKSRNSSWPYWILLFVIGALIGTIIYMNR